MTSMRTKGVATAALLEHLPATDLHNCTVSIKKSLFAIYVQNVQGHYTDKKENEIFLIYKEIQMGSVAKSYMRKGFLIYDEMRKYLTIFEEAVSHI
jgi:hypothetical protein